MTDGPVLAGLSISDPPERWRALGLAVDGAGELSIGGVRLVLGIAPPGQGIAGWSLRQLPVPGDIDGLATTVATSEFRGREEHPNGAIAVDHVVIATPDFDRTAGVLQARGMELRRVGERAGRRQGFRRLGGPIMEIVEAAEAPATAFWGVAFTVAHLDALGPLVDAPRAAVQPGRRIASVSRDAGLSTRVAFMDPEPDG